MAAIAEAAPPAVSVRSSSVASCPFTITRGSPAALSRKPISVSNAQRTNAEASEQVTLVTLAPGEGKEVKLVMDEGGRATYAWATDRGVVNYDTHADGVGIDYHGYGKGTGVASDEGVLVAAFDGKHGWYWRNRTNESLTVTLRTSGDVQRVVGP